MSNFTINKSSKTTFKNNRIYPQNSPNSAAVSSEKTKLISKWELVGGKLVCNWIVGQN